ncbi:hypothetical protein D3C78_1887960 [compost metagenome]
MPHCATLYDGSRLMSRPSKTMLPWVAGVSPITVFTVVDLPMPLRPSKVTNSPGPISRSMPNSAWLAP